MTTPGSTSQEPGDGWGHLAFDILHVHEGRVPTKEPPFHAEDGDWTFLECRASQDHAARFIVGLLHRPMSVWGKAWLAVPDRHSGERLLQLFADAFFEVVPPPRPPRPLEPHLFGTANLNDLRQVSTEPDDGWYATKWFPGLDRYDAEVYFNYNLSLMRGEFEEKDPDYRTDLLGILASVFRDGPPPARTPATDPNVTDVGPRIGEVRLLLPRRCPHYVFTANGRLLIYQDGTALYALAPHRPSEPFQLSSFEHPLWDIRPVDDEPNLLVREVVPTEPPYLSSNDPMRIWWVDGARGTKRLLRGPEKWVDLCGSPVSPDQRYVALTKSQDRTDQRLMYTVALLVNRETGQTWTIDIPNLSLTPVGWRGEGADLRVVLVTNRWAPDREQRVYLADPATGSWVRDDGPAQLGVVSPDGRLLATIEAEERLVLTDLVTGERRSFVFSEDDLPFVHAECVKWVGPHYLQFEGRPLGLIDVRTLKMNFPAGNSEVPSHSYCFSPDLTWVAFEKEDLEGRGLYLGRVVMARDNADA